MDSEEDSSKLMDLLKQHWSHARHVSKLSINFLSIYLATFVGAFALTKDPSQDLLTPLALVGISVAGIVIQVKYGLEFYHHIRLANVISREENVSNWMIRSLGIQTIESDLNTPSLFSPQHLLVLTQTFGTSLSVGWVFWALYGVIAGITACVVTIIILIISIYLIVKEYQTLIDKEIQNRTGKEVY